MKNIVLVLLFTTITILSFGQTVKVQGGISYSSLNPDNRDLYGDQIKGYAFLVGLDYVDKKFFNLSSNIGLYRKGGSDEPLGAQPDFDSPSNTLKATLDYLTINTTFDLKYGLKQYGSPFISVGPRFDYLVSSSEDFQSYFRSPELNKYNYGLNIGIGYKYEIQEAVFGLRADYYASFLGVVESNDGIITDQTYTITATIGINIKHY